MFRPAHSPSRLCLGDLFGDTLDLNGERWADMAELQSRRCEEPFNYRFTTTRYDLTDLPWLSRPPFLVGLRRDTRDHFTKLPTTHRGYPIVLRLWTLRLSDGKPLVMAEFHIAVPDRDAALMLRLSC